VGWERGGEYGEWVFEEFDHGSRNVVSGSIRCLCLLSSRPSHPSPAPPPFLLRMDGKERKEKTHHPPRQRTPFRTHPHRKTRIFDISTRDDDAVVGEEGGADAEIGVGTWMGGGELDL